MGEEVCSYYEAQYRILRMHPGSEEMFDGVKVERLKYVATNYRMLIDGAYTAEMEYAAVLKALVTMGLVVKFLVPRVCPVCCEVTKWTSLGVDEGGGYQCFECEAILPGKALAYNLKIEQELEAYRVLGTPEELTELVRLSPTDKALLSPESEKVIGEIMPAKTMLLREDVGEAKMGENEYEMTVNVGGRNPIVHGRKTGKWYVLSWEDICNLAIKAGIDDD